MIELRCMGKLKGGFLETGIELYQKRLGQFVKFSITELNAVKASKKVSPLEVKKLEAKVFEKYNKPGEIRILLDEHGKHHTSVEFSAQLQRWLNQGQHLVFLVGGAYGFDDEVRRTAHGKLALSKMTFSHQMIRLLFVEQLYRGFSILHNLPYHNE